MATLADTLAQLKKRNEADARAREMQFTPKQQQMIADK